MRSLSRCGTCLALAAALLAAPSARGACCYFAARNTAILQAGLVGSFDYKVIKAERADELFKWLRDHNYRYAGDEATLDFYVRKGHFFTVMKIDTMQMKKNKDGSYAGDVTPTRFTFATD